jgi:hypothetical protein
VAKLRSPSQDTAEVQRRRSGKMIRFQYNHNTVEHFANTRRFQLLMDIALSAGHSAHR